MILDINPHNLAEPDCPIFSQRCCGGAPLEISQSIHRYSSFAIEMKLSRMILGIGPHNRPELNFPGTPRWCCWGTPSEIFESNHNLQYLSAWFDMIIPSYRSGQSVWEGFSRCRGGSQNFEIFCGRRFMHVLLSRRRRIHYLLHLSDDCSVGSALFFKDYIMYVVSVIGLFV